jgi:transcriptional regulator with XRE-family HTH domain
VSDGIDPHRFRVVTVPRKVLRSKEHRAIAAVITACRRDAGLKQAQLAEAIGWTQSTLARIESGERIVAAAELFYIAKALKLDPVKLFSRIAAWR